MTHRTTPTRAGTRAARRTAAGLLLLAATLAGGCAPRLIRDYNVRAHELVFVYSQGSSYAIGDCQRAPSGELSNCKTYPVEFD